MKKMILTFGALLCMQLVFAQSESDYIEIARSVLKTEKKAAVAEVMELTDAESGPFWSLYEEYTNKAYQIQNKRVALIKDYADNYGKLTDEKADEIWSSYLGYKAEMLKLDKQYYKKFKKILPVKKAAMFFQVENKIETLISAELATQIPLIE